MVLLRAVAAAAGCMKKGYYAITHMHVHSPPGQVLPHLKVGPQKI